MFLPYVHRIEVPHFLSSKEKSEFINSEISGFMRKTSGVSQKHLPSLRMVAENLYDLIYVSDSKYELSAAIKAKVAEAPKEVQRALDTLPAGFNGSNILEVAKGHQGSTGISHSKT